MLSGIFGRNFHYSKVTDCNSLAQILSKKLINCRIARWALELENYEYSISHRRAEVKYHVDALSRAPIIAMIDGGDIDINIQIKQTRDTRIQTIRSKLETVDLEDYVLENGLVFRLGDKGLMQLYVPAELEENVMRLTHEKYSHVGVEKCMKQIKKYYWFPNMRDKMNKFIRNCLKCIFNSAPYTKN